MNKTAKFDLETSVQDIEAAQGEGQLTATAVENIKVWLTDSRYEDYAQSVADHIEKKMWKELDDVFWTTIPFGTGGRRGKMYEFGSNAINERTIGESAQGLADYVKEVKPEGPWSFGIAYDTRHRSREFAELCAGIMVANGFKVYFIDDYRSTPELSFLIRYKNCDCGIMVTASHNPPSDNAVKVYWSSGAQLIPPPTIDLSLKRLARFKRLPPPILQTPSPMAILSCAVKKLTPLSCKSISNTALMDHGISKSSFRPCTALVSSTSNRSSMRLASTSWRSTKATANQVAISPMFRTTFPILKTPRSLMKSSSTPRQLVLSSSSLLTRTAIAWVRLLRSQPTNQASGKRSAEINLVSCLPNTFWTNGNRTAA